MCGKPENTSNLQDLLVYTLKGIALYAEELSNRGEIDNSVGRFVIRALFATITNANFDDDRMENLITEGLKLRDQMAEKSGLQGDLHDATGGRKAEGILQIWQKNSPMTRSFSLPAAPSTGTISWNWAISGVSPGCSMRDSATIPTRWP